jgi:hypothetical protein
MKCPTYPNIVNKLANPDFLSSLEYRNYSIKGEHLDSTAKREVYRRTQSLYDATCSGRFNLCISCKRKFPEYLDIGNTGKAHVWMRTQFANNAILW